MKIVKVYGGLGNQMFQYSFSRALAAVAGEEAVYLDCEGSVSDSTHNGLELDSVFGLELRRAPEAEALRLATRPTSLVNRLRRKYLTKRTHVIDKKFVFQPGLLSKDGDAYLEGYWQSEKYFLGIEGEIRRAFRFARPLAPRNEALLASLSRPLASIHVRRGDYLKYPNLNICTPGYYRRGIERLRALGAAARFLVLSDDIAYCKASLGLSDAEAAFVDWNRGPDAWQDMAMMSRCDNHVIANSSFSWWGAWLDPIPGKKVVAPSVWNRREIDDKDDYYAFGFGDVVPEAWERIAL